MLLRLKRVTKDTLVCDDDAHKADMCTSSHVLIEIKEDDSSEDTPCDNGKKTRFKHF